MANEQEEIGKHFMILESVGVLFELIYHSLLQTL